MKNFMFIFRGGLDPQTASPEDFQQNMDQWMQWVSSLQANGTYIAGEALMPSGKTLHKGNLITDGPFVESKEIVGGFFIIRAASIEDATSIAQGSPDLPLGGSVEIRDVVVFE